MGRDGNIGSHPGRLDPAGVTETIFTIFTFLLGHPNLLIEVVDASLPVLPATEVESNLWALKAFQHIMDYIIIHGSRP